MILIVSDHCQRTINFNCRSIYGTVPKMILIISIAYKDKKNYICFVKNLLSRIFTLYIIMLALIPCPDVCTTNACLTDEKIHIEQNSHENEHCDDLCSPFCVCFCCNDVTSVSDIYLFEYFNKHTTLIQSEYLHSSFHYLESSSPPPKS